MADTFTTNLNLTKPEVGSSTDTWGTKLNADLDTLDAIFNATGSAVNQRFASANFDDGAKAIFGSGDDLEIYHDGSNSYIKDTGTGSLVFDSDAEHLFRSISGSPKAIFNSAGSVELYNSGAKKFETSATGATLTGNLAVTGTVDGVDIAALNSSLATVATSGSYNDLSNKPTIPTNNNQLSNGAGYVTTNTTYSGGTGISISGTTINRDALNPSDCSLGNLYSNGNNVTGSFTASGNITAFSSRKLKSDIKTIDNALDKVSQMRGVTFTKDKELSSGVIAEEFEQVAPELVLDGEYKSVAYGNTVGYLIEAIKELKNEVEELKTKKLCECK